MYYQGTGQLEIRGRQYRLVLEGSLAHLRGLGDDWMISPRFPMGFPSVSVVVFVWCLEGATDRWEKTLDIFGGKWFHWSRWCLLRQHVFF